MLDVEHLSKTYGAGPKAVRAISDLTFGVGRGEFVCIVGPSGAGKTTLLKCLSGLMAPSSGVAKLHGEPIVSTPATLALVFQDYTRSLLPWMTVRGNVMLPLRAKGLGKREQRRLADEALTSVGLGGFADRHPWELSGGMQQRVAIARGLAYQPQILLMDEPFASVDAQTRADLEDLILKVRDEFGITIVFVTHDIDESVYLGDRVVVLSPAPARVVEVVDVDLPAPRDQVATKGMPEFAELRARVFQLIKRPTGTPTATPRREET